MSFWNVLRSLCDTGSPWNSCPDDSWCREVCRMELFSVCRMKPKKFLGSSKCWKTCWWMSRPLVFEWIQFIFVLVPASLRFFFCWKPLLHPTFQCFGLGEHLIPKTSNLNDKLKLPTLCGVSCAGVLFTVMTWNKHSSQPFPVVVLFFAGHRWMSSRRTPIRIWSSWRCVCFSSIWDGE